LTSAAAFAIGERARARAFLDVLAFRTSLSRKTTPELLTEEQRLLARIEDIRALTEEGEAASERVRLLAGAREAYDRFLDRLLRESPSKRRL
jgi:hypothetical protein